MNAVEFLLTCAECERIGTFVRKWQHTHTFVAEEIAAFVLIFPRAQLKMAARVDKNNDITNLSVISYLYECKSIFYNHGLKVLGVCI